MNQGERSVRTVLSLWTAEPEFHLQCKNRSGCVFITLVLWRWKRLDMGGLLDNGVFGKHQHNEGSCIKNAKLRWRLRNNIRNCPVASTHTYTCVHIYS